ncbi:TlpA family protein disulfide reductase [Pedobacter sp. N23S346]|uniref:TlpA family protein disulfide reductase n=1 Tax=Pedobacter sp. N23S346 TaxID=3402750 RepID=UPI003ACE87B6
MVKLIISVLAMFFFMSNAKAQLLGNIPTLADTTWTIEGNEISPIPIKADKSGHFEMDIKVLKQGFYNFGKVGLIYIEPDYTLTVTQQANKYHFEGSGKIENDVLQKMNGHLNQFLGNPGYALWHQYLLTEPNLFIPMLDDYIKKTNASADQSKNTFFKAFIKREAELDKRYCLAVYSRFYGLDSTKMTALRQILAVPIADRKENHTQKLMDAYQSQFSKKLSVAGKDSLNNIIYDDLDLNNEMLYCNSKYYKELIALKIDYLTYGKNYEKMRDSIKNEDKIKLIILESLINNAYIKEQFTYRYSISAIKKAKQPDDVNDVYQSFLSKSKDEVHKAEIRKTYQNLSATLSSALSPNFKYKNPAGQLVSLTNLKGKYVYIDIWATWCGPCIAEIPSLKKLEERYRSKKIKFVSISVDIIENKQKWLDFVKNNSLGGIQLMADKDFKSDFIKTFGITTIPRFILIGPDGKIIDNNAKRPSDVKLATQFDTLKM